MTLRPAPFYDAISEAPEGTRACWLTTPDGPRIRIAYQSDGENGTVLLFSGRTEFVEKYGGAIDDLAKRGFATLTMDWRGQGLADRLITDAAIGHIDDFSDYQQDLRAILDAAESLDLPRPYYMLAHSMGGGIGLRALIEGLDVRAAAFTAPMWGIKISPLMRPVAWLMSCASRFVGLGHLRVPGTKAQTYVLSDPFEGNELTTDPDAWEKMRGQVIAHPELALGGPSLNWLYEGLCETRALRRADLPDIPALVFLGSNERIVDVPPMLDLVNRWPSARLITVEGAEHEVLVEADHIRTPAFDQIAAFFADHP